MNKIIYTDISYYMESDIEEIAERDYSQESIKSSKDL